MEIIHWRFTFTNYSFAVSSTEVHWFHSVHKVKSWIGCDSLGGWLLVLDFTESCYSELCACLNSIICLAWFIYIIYVPTYLWSPQKWPMEPWEHDLEAPGPFPCPTIASHRFAVLLLYSKLEVQRSWHWEKHATIKGTKMFSSGVNSWL